MTGLKVVSVNIHIQGINMPENRERKENIEPQE